MKFLPETVSKMSGTSSLLNTPCTKTQSLQSSRSRNQNLTKTKKKACRSGHLRVPSDGQNRNLSALGSGNTASHFFALFSAEGRSNFSYLAVFLQLQFHWGKPFQRKLRSACEFLWTHRKPWAWEGSFVASASSGHALRGTGSTHRSIQQITQRKLFLKDLQTDSTWHRLVNKRPPVFLLSR